MIKNLEGKIKIPLKLHIVLTMTEVVDVTLVITVATRDAWWAIVG